MCASLGASALHYRDYVTLIHFLRKREQKYRRNLQTGSHILFLSLSLMTCANLHSPIAHGHTGVIAPESQLYSLLHRKEGDKLSSLIYSSDQSGLMSGAILRGKSSLSRSHVHGRNTRRFLRLKCFFFLPTVLLFDNKSTCAAVNFSPVVHSLFFGSNCYNPWGIFFSLKEKRVILFVSLSFLFLFSPRNCGNGLSFSPN